MEDNVVAMWVLDFMLRQPLHVNDLNRLARCIPNTDTPSNLKKLLLLRKTELELSTGSITEKILELLEQIEELEYRDKVTVTETMRRAYCAVAVHCTVRILEEGEYLEAVKRIWRSRVSEMEKREDVGLVGEELLSWRDDIETAIWDKSVKEKVLEKWKEIDVAGAVWGFVGEFKNGLGPCFLELLADKLAIFDPVADVMGLASKGISYVFGAYCFRC